MANLSNKFSVNPDKVKAHKKKVKVSKNIMFAVKDSCLERLEPILHFIFGNQLHYFLFRLTTLKFILNGKFVCHFVQIIQSVLTRNLNSNVSGIVCTEILFSCICQC